MKKTIPRIIPGTKLFKLKFSFIRLRHIAPIRKAPMKNRLMRIKSGDSPELSAISAITKLDPHIIVMNSKTISKNLSFLNFINFFPSVISILCPRLNQFFAAICASYHDQVELRTAISNPYLCKL